MFAACPQRQGRLFAVVLTLAGLAPFLTPSPASAQIKATICVTDGAPIYDDQFAAWIQDIIPPGIKTLIVLTECYGGNVVDNFDGRANVAVAAATSPGERADYGAYDQGAVGALKPGAGRTGQTVHKAGTANKSKFGTENPTSGGGLALSDFPLDETSATGPVHSRHVLVYAGKPNNKDNMFRNFVLNNFKGQPNTTVHTAGGAGTGGWEKPGNAKGLRDALTEIAALLTNAQEQCIIYITDHGDLHYVHEILSAPVAPGCFYTRTNLPTLGAGDLGPSAITAPGFSVAIQDGSQVAPARGPPSAFLPGQWSLDVSANANFAQAVSYTNFVTLTNDATGAVTLLFPVDADFFRSNYFNTNINLRVLNNSGATHTIAAISQDSGDIAKTENSYCRPLAGDLDGDPDRPFRLADPIRYWGPSGTWTIFLSASAYAPFEIVFGDADTEPAVGDFDGDGKSDPANYMPTNGVWTIMLSGQGFAPVTLQFSAVGGYALAADFDGDGRADFCNYEAVSARWELLLSGNNYTPTTFDLGGVEFLPVAADFDGDGKADPGIYNQETGAWTLLLSGSAYAPVALAHGGAAELPVAGDFDGDGKADPGTYNVLNGAWTIRLSSAGYMPVVITF